MQFWTQTQTDKFFLIPYPQFSDSHDGFNHSPYRLFRPVPLRRLVAPLCGSDMEMIVNAGTAAPPKITKNCKKSVHAGCSVYTGKMCTNTNVFYKKVICSPTDPGPVGLYLDCGPSFEAPCPRGSPGVNVLFSNSNRVRRRNLFVLRCCLLQLEALLVYYNPEVQTKPFWRQICFI